MKEIKTTEAAGHILCHDITQIIPGKFKGARFKKGHIVREEDIPVLLSLGKEHLFVWENDESMLHENDAAQILCGICRGGGMAASEPSEGKIELRAEYDGLFKVDSKALYSLNSLGNICTATLHGNTPVKKGDKLCGMRVIPLAVKKELMERARSVSKTPILSLMPYLIKRAAVVTTGGEIKNGLIEDKFTPALRRKLAAYGVEVTENYMPGDDSAEITKAIESCVSGGAELILCTGGMSVDPDDRTPLAIKNTGADIITYGAPVLPGAMILMSYLNGVPLIGLPGCVMYAKSTVFDIILPRVLAGDILCKEDFIRMGEGGFCRGCAECHYPVCGFGK